MDLTSFLNNESYMIPIYTKPLACMSSLSLCALVVLLCPDIVLGADNPNTFTPLVGIPGLTDNANKRTLPEYINAVYMLTITIGALYGVVKIAFAGVKYSMSGVVTDKSEARKDILNVLGGLAVLLLPFVVLNTINPELIRLDVLRGAPKIELGKFPSSGGTPVIDPYTSNLKAGTTRTRCINPASCESECTQKGGKIYVPQNSGGTGLKFCDAPSV